MPVKRKPPRKKKTPTRTSDFWSASHREEIVGLLLMALGVLLALAFLTYDPADNALARTFSLDTFFHPRSIGAHNALGHVGAWLSYWFVARFLGYPVLLWPLLALIWGYHLFRHRPPRKVSLTLGLLTLGTWMLSTFAGWMTLVWEFPLKLWSGSVGLSTARWLRQLFGSTGSFLILLFGIAAIARLFIDRDIQHTFDQLEHRLRLFFQRIKQTWKSYREKRAKAKRSAAKPVSRSSSPVLPKVTPASDPAPVASPPPPVSSETNELPVHNHREEELTLHVQPPVEEEKVTLEPRNVTEHSLQRFPYTFPPTDLLDAPEEESTFIDYEELEENKRILLEKLSIYNIEITHIDAIVGPTVTLYELTPTPGVKISRITALENDLAMALAAPGIRMIAPIPGKSAIGIEIPNRHRELVRIASILNTARFRDANMELPVTLGKTIEGTIFLQDLTRMPHLLIAGATGSGKSVGLNALIVGLLYACHPADLKFVLIDPKKIELSQYTLIADHFIAMPEGNGDPIITETAQALYALKSCEKEMELRYDLLKRAGVRGIKEYNQKLKQGKLNPEEGFKHLPYIVVIIDELADLMLTAGKDIEGPIARLAQMARAVGIHLVLATQRPSVDVITGLIKANFPSRIAYQVASKVDSRTILDQNGAEQLVGNGDLLYMHGSQVIRLQGPFISVEEVERITSFIARQPGPGPYLLPALVSDEEDPLSLPSSGERDELFEEAARIIVRSQQGSVSLLQRKLSIGYTRAARIIDQLEEAGIVGPFEGSKARQVLVTSETELDSLLHGNLNA